MKVVMVIETYTACMKITLCGMCPMRTCEVAKRKISVPEPYQAL